MVVLAVVAVAGYWFASRPDGVTRTLAAPDCKLNTAPCTAMLPGGGRLTLEAGTRPVPLVKPFTVRVRAEGVTLDAVMLEFTGADMDMGINRVEMRATPEGFVGEASLPVCVTGAMRWRATVQAQTPQGRFAVPFDFSTGG